MVREIPGNSIVPEGTELGPRRLFVDSERFDGELAREVEAVVRKVLSRGQGVGCEPRRLSAVRNAILREREQDESTLIGGRAPEDSSAIVKAAVVDERRQRLSKAKARSLLRILYAGLVAIETFDTFARELQIERSTEIVVAIAADNVLQDEVVLELAERFGHNVFAIELRRVLRSAAIQAGGHRSAS